MALPTGTNGTPASLQSLHTDDTFHGFSSKSLQITPPGPLCLARPRPAEPPLCEDPRPDRVFFICSVFFFSCTDFALFLFAWPCCARTVPPVATWSSPTRWRRSVKKLDANSVALEAFEVRPRWRRGLTVRKNILLYCSCVYTSADRAAVRPVWSGD